MIASRQDVQVRSYMIWEREGRPQGRDWDHWFRAEAELTMEHGKLEKAVAAVSPETRGPQTPKSRATKQAKAKKT